MRGREFGPSPRSPVLGEAFGRPMFAAHCLWAPHGRQCRGRDEGNRLRAEGVWEYWRARRASRGSLAPEAHIFTGCEELST